MRDADWATLDGRGKPCENRISDRQAGVTRVSHPETRIPHLVTRIPHRVPPMPPWKLAETTYSHVKHHQYEVAVLPLGATEPHNLHLPYGMDQFEGSIIGEAICQAADERGGNVVLLPTIPYGTQTNMREMPLAMNLNPSTLTAVVADLVESLELAGIRKVVLLNSHGGNEIKSILRELTGKTKVHLFLCNWYTSFNDRYHEIFENPEDHAGEMETSFALAYFPELIGRNDDGSFVADEGRARPLRFEAMREGWVSITRPWHLLTTNAGSGNPHAAAAEKAHKMMEILVERLGSFLVELSASEIDEWFPFEPS
jgi:creatinine amidohydrolase